MIYIIGHKSPDLDSVVAAISLANLKNKLAGTDIYVPAIAGEVNRETKYILERFKFDIPQKPESLAGKEVILVDHNEESHAFDGIEKAEIREVLDHHKVNFKYDEPMEFKTLPWGSTATIIAREYFENNVKMDKKLASIMLAAVLSDTVITKSPTCTDIDRQIIDKLSEEAGIADWHEFGMGIFKVRSSVNELSNEEIIKYDFKDYEMKAGKFGIGQIETVDLKDFTEKEAEFLDDLNELRVEEGYYSVILFITDIIKGGSKFLIASPDMENIQKALGEEIVDGEVYIDGIISRKKQVIPMLSKIFDK